MLAVLVVLALLVIRNWAQVRAIASDSALKFGLTDSPKHSTLPERVTASNEAPSPAPGSGSQDSPISAEKSDSRKKEPAQAAKLDKPQSDSDATAESA